MEDKKQDSNQDYNRVLTRRITRHAMPRPSIMQAKVLVSAVLRASST